MSNPISKRKLFKAIVPDQKILEHLDFLHLGYLARRKARVTLAKKYDANEKYDRIQSHRNITRIRGRLQGDVHKQRRDESPYPFNKEGKFLFKASEWRSVPRSFPGNPPEIAIIGRSNVGKSTLLNCLLALEENPMVKANVSLKPGETKHLQFYGVGRSQTIQKGAERGTFGPALVLTDMPGFGFSYMNEGELLRCQEISKQYLTQRGSSLKRVLLLLDSRHGLKVGDEAFFRDLFSTKTAALNGEGEEERQRFIYPGDKDSQVKWKLQIVLTKCDLVERFELARRIQVLKEKMREMLPKIGYTELPILALSSMENRGVLELKKELISLVVRDSPDKSNDDDGNFTGTDNNVRVWRPASYSTVSDELDRSFRQKGDTVEKALGMKDSTRHKQPAGKGSWISNRVNDDTVKTVKTDKGNEADRGDSKYFFGNDSAARYADSFLVKTPSSTNLGGLQHTSNQARLNSINSGMTSGSNVDLAPKDNILTPYKGLQSKRTLDTAYSNTSLNDDNLAKSGTPALLYNINRIEKVPLISLEIDAKNSNQLDASLDEGVGLSKKRKVWLSKAGIGSGAYSKQMLERKRLLPLTNMTLKEKSDFKKKSGLANLEEQKRSRKMSVERMSRRAQRDIQFGRVQVDDNGDVVGSERSLDSLDLSGGTSSSSIGSIKKESVKKSYSADPNKKPKMNRRERRYAASFNGNATHPKNYVSIKEGAGQGQGLSMDSEEKKNEYSEERKKNSKSSDSEGDRKSSSTVGRVKTKYGKAVGSKARNDKAKRRADHFAK